MSFAIAVPAVTFALFLVKQRLDQRAANPKRLPYAPGPPSLPLIGNLFDTPTENDWLVYSEWAKKYGEGSNTFD